MPDGVFSILALSILCSCVGVSQGVFEANKCLSSNAFYNDSITLCQCDPGYKGLGDLCCDNIDEYSNCNVGGDPWLSSYDGTSAAYNWPCVSRVAVITGTTGSGRQCTVEVMTSAKLVEKGAAYPDRVVVTFTVDGSGRQAFKLIGNTVQRPGDSQAYPSSDLYRRRLHRTTVSGEMIRIAFVSSRLIWTITGCDTKVTFRAAQDSSAVQYNRPGICVSVKKDSSVQPSGQVDKGDVCSVTSSGQGVSEAQLPYKILSDVVQDYTRLGEDSKDVHPDYLVSCAGVDTVLSDECGNDPARIRTAVSACASLFYNQPIKLCMSILGATGSGTTDYFSACLGFQCNPKPIECDAYVNNSKILKTCLPSFCRL